MPISLLRARTLSRLNLCRSWAPALLCLEEAVSWRHPSPLVRIIFPPRLYISPSLEDGVPDALQFKQGEERDSQPSDCTHHSSPKLRGFVPHPFSPFILRSGVLAVLMGPIAWHCILF